MRLFLTGGAARTLAAAVVIGGAALATATTGEAAQVASGPSALAARGVTLAPDEQNAKVVIIGGQPGTQQSAVVTPRGCAAKSCQSVVTSSVPATASPQPTEVVALNQASVDAPPSTAGTTNTSAVTAASVNVRGLSFDDQMCSNLGCTAWHFHLNTTVYYEGYYAWGSRSRYGYAGSITCTAGSVFYSASQQVCRFYNDPDPTQFYGAAQYHISAPWPTGISEDHYIHRHVNKDGHYWIVST